MKYPPKNIEDDIKYICIWNFLIYVIYYIL
jgi:hypothetical protein